MSANFFIIAFLTLVHCMYAAAADQCIGSFDALRTLEVKRGNKNAISVTYVICPNTVFDFDNHVDQWEMNGNTNYLCGADGSSKNNCIITGGEAQFLIYFYSFGQSSKDNILISGFTFKNSAFANGSIGIWGKHIIRDCIFKVSVM